MAGRLALLAFFGALAAQQGCATRLDFAGVSAGHGASASDAAVGKDAMVDSALSAAGDASPNPATFSCAKIEPEPALCDDFEAVDALSQWGPLVIDPELPQPAGSIGVDDSAARAGRGSLLAIVDPGVATCSQCDLSVCVEARFFELQGHQQLSIDFDMRVEQIDEHDDRRAALFQFSWGSPERGYSQHTLQVRASGEGAEAAFIEYDTVGQSVSSGEAPSWASHEHGFKPGPKLQEWVHVRYELDALDSDGSGNALSLTVGSVSLIDGPLYFGLRYREPVLQLGVPFVDSAGLRVGESNEGWQVRFDNLLVRTEPR